MFFSTFRILVFALFTTIGLNHSMAGTITIGIMVPTDLDASQIGGNTITPAVSIVTQTEPTGLVRLKYNFTEMEYLEFSAGTLRPSWGFEVSNLSNTGLVTLDTFRWQLLDELGGILVDEPFFDFGVTLYSSGTDVINFIGSDRSIAKTIAHGFGVTFNADAEATYASTSELSFTTSPNPPVTRVWTESEAVPEPTSIATWVVLGLAAIGFRRRRKSCVGRQPQ